MAPLYEIRELFSNTKKSTYHNTEGVMCFDSGKSGPTVGILIMTHGNEPSGLFTFSEFYTNSQSITKGKLLFVVQNIQAAGNYFANKKSLVNNRFVDFNLNRFPKTVQKNDHRSEAKRGIDLQKLYKVCDVLIDIHSTSQFSEPMALVFNKNDLSFFSSIPVTNTIVGLDKIQTGKSVINLAPRRTKKIAIESGPHLNKKAHQDGLFLVMSILLKLKMISSSKSKIKANKSKLYFAYKSIVLRHGFALTKRFKNFERVKKGQKFAISKSGKHLYFTEDAYTLFCPKDFKNVPAGEEALFLLKR